MPGEGASPNQPAPGASPQPGSSPESAFPVSAINAIVRRLLEGSFPSLWIVGEIANWRRHASGHCYFSLRDDSAQLSCVMFRADAERLPTDPEEGMQCSALGRLTVYETRGSYQLVVRSLEARGEGLWRLAFERLRAKLSSEGLFDPARKRTLPRVPSRIGIATSRSGAALRDVLAVVRRRAPWTRVIVCDCRVQGEEAVPEILAALDRLVRHGGSEAIIVTRGGGSVEDLWAFNDERLARAIAACPVPTVSAVGHETDVTIADLVADYRAPTPSAAAESVVPDGVALAAGLGRLAEGLVGGLRARVRRAEDRGKYGAESLIRSFAGSLRERRTRVHWLGGRLDVLSPLGTLRRGYAVPLGRDGEVLRRGAMFQRDSRFELRVVDARVGCRVEEVVANEEERHGSGD